MRVTIRRRAGADIAAARAWYDEQREGVGDTFYAAVRESIERVTGAPLSYPVVYRDVRRALLKHFPYALFFTIQGERVRVIACLHARQDPAELRSRQ